MIRKASGAGCPEGDPDQAAREGPESRPTIAIGTRREMLGHFAGTLAIPTVVTVLIREPSPNPIDAIQHQATCWPQ